ncbi:MAG: ATP-dependent Clp protease adaptor ClpS [Fimbriimonadaceae bacterium]|nr:ATP-dependent Clp protease adaptor ClpS [Fimbriimonadaceae bacterium]
MDGLTIGTKIWNAGPGVLEPVVLPTLDPDLDDLTHGSGRYVVIVYDNDENSVDEVREILIIATGCTWEEADMETWEVHHLGQSVVHHGAEKECRHVAGIIREIGIKVEVRQE